MPEDQAKSQVSPAKKRKRGAPPGNRNALKHGFYSRKALAEEEKPLKANANLSEEIEALRVLIRRVMQRLQNCDSRTELITALAIISGAAYRVAKIMQLNKALFPEEDPEITKLRAQFDAFFESRIPHHPPPPPEELNY